MKEIHKKIDEHFNHLDEFIGCGVTSKGITIYLHESIKGKVIVPKQIDKEDIFVEYCPDYSEFA